MASTSVSNTTASFVVEILASAGRLDKNDLNARIGELVKKIEEVKVEVYESLQKKYADFFPNLNAAIDLQQRVKAIQEEMDSTVSKIESEIKGQLNVSTTEFNDLSKQLAESNAIMTILGKLDAVESRRKAMDLALRSNDYTSAATKLEEIQKLMDTQVHDREEEVKILTVLRNKFLTDKQKLIYDLGEIWSSNVKWILPKEGDSQYHCTISLATNNKDIKAKTVSTIQAMHYLDILEPKLKIFGGRFLQFVTRPIVENPNVTVKDSVGETAQLQLKPAKKPRDSASELTTIFGSIYAAVEFLNKHLFSVKLDQVEKADAKVTLMQHFSELIWEDFVDFVVTTCLANSIPTSKKELDEYPKVIAHTEKFQASMIKAGFLPSSCTALTDYTNNVNVLFANKKSQEILEKARELLTQDLHNTVRVSDSAPFGKLPILVGGHDSSRKEKKTAENVALANNNGISASTFRLPTCQISLSVQTLISMAYETLNEATKSTPQCAIQLFYSVRNMFELFCNVVPTFHKENLDSLPQLSAIFHNNCMYVAHHLITLGHQYKNKLPEPLRAGAATFIDMVPKIRRLGTEAFLQQMTKQKQQMLDYLTGTNGFMSASEDDNFLASEKAIKQVLHQLNHLARVWRVVLPSNIYSKSIGTLLNSVLVEVCTSITSLEDISSDDAIQLHSLLRIISMQASDLFILQDGNEQEVKEADSSAGPTDATGLLHQNVAKWCKLLEVQMMLNASLQEIGDRWSDGKGPLAHELGANEVKQMVRALFQNTDRRAAVLAKIR